MMTSTPPPVQDSTSIQARHRPSASDRLRFFRIAAVVSLLVHGAVVLIFLLPHHAPSQKAQPEQGTVELLMVEQKGAQASQAGQPPDPVPPVTRAQDKMKILPGTVPMPPVQAEQGDEPVPAPVPEQAKPLPEQTKPAPEQTKDDPAEPVKPTIAEPSPAPSKQGPVFDLEGTDSDTNAMVLSGRILPAALDDRFRNRPPPYPNDAAMRGEQGNVLVVIHVAASGLAAGAEVAQSSGSASLDEAAITAVKKWHFHPAMKEGQPIPFDMEIRFDFRPF